MLRKFFGNNEAKFGLALLGFLCVLCYILLSRFKGVHAEDLEKVYVVIFGIGFALWARIEAIGISKIEYNDTVERMEKLYFDQCRFERAICEKFNVVYRPDKNGLETFYDKDEYYEKEYRKAKKWLEENNAGTN